jgi:surface antigen
MASITTRKKAIGGVVAGRHRLRPRGMTILAATILALVPSLGWAADDPRDATFLAPVLQRVLETERVDVQIPWNNPATGNRGSIVVERTFYREPGVPCRAFVRTLESAGAAPQVTKGMGCRSSTGLWLIEEEPESLAAGAPGATRGLSPPDVTALPPHEVEPAGGPTCPDTVLVPMPTERPPAFAYTLPSRAEL